MKTTQRLLGAGLGLSLALTTSCAGEGDPAPNNEPTCKREAVGLFNGGYPVRFIGKTGLVLDKKAEAETTSAAASAVAKFLLEHQENETVKVGGTVTAYGTKEQLDAETNNSNGVMQTMAEKAAQGVSDTLREDHDVIDKRFSMEPGIGMVFGAFNIPPPTDEKQWIHFDFTGSICSTAPYPTPTS